MFVIYKENNIPTVGGVHPQGIETSLAYYEGWNLADCPTEKIHEYKEFNFIAVPKNVVNGLKLLDTAVEEDDGSPEGTITNFTLSIKDETDIEAAKTFINNINLKLVTRAKVREMKDIEDDLVDLKKMVQSMITFAVDDWNNKPESEKSNSKFKSIFPDLTSAISSNKESLSTIDKDLEKIEEIVDLEVAIAAVVDNYYLSKKL